MNLPALWLMFTVGMKRVAAERAALVGQVVVYAVLLLAYGVLFRGIAPAALARYGLDRTQLVWYFVLTQAQVACCYMHYREMEHTVLSGAIEAMLLRPVPFGWLVLAQWFGQYCMRLMMILPAGCLGAWLMTGDVPPHPGRLALLMIPSVAMGGMLFLCLHFLVGCCAAWTNPTEPVFRLAQKGLYFIGARSWPLILYPAFLQALAWCTPFPAIMAVPGNLSTHAGAGAVMVEITVQVAWVVIILAVTGIMTRAVTRRVGHVL